MNRADIRAMIRQELRHLTTNYIGRVVAVDASAQRVDVQPLVDKARPQVGNEAVVYTRCDVIRDVPLALPRTGRGGAYVEVQVGDMVELRGVMHSLDELLTTDVTDPVEPADVRNHDIGDCLAYPITFNTRPATSASADLEFIADDVRLGRPNASKALVQDDGTAAGLQSQLDAFTNRIEAEIEASSLAVGNAVINKVIAAGLSISTLISVANVNITPPTVDKTDHVKAS